MRLAEVCNKAPVSHHLEKAVGVVVAFGVAVPVELSEVADEICNQSVMKPLERKRFLALLRPEQFSGLASALITESTRRAPGPFDIW